MKPLSLAARCVVCFVLLGTGTAWGGPTDTWTGTLPTGWRGGVTPSPGDDIFLGTAVNRTVVLPGSISLHSIYFAPGDDDYAIDSPSPVTLTLTNGLFPADGTFGHLAIEPNVTLSATGTPIFDAGNNTILVYSKLTGTAAPTFLTTGGSGYFNFINVTGANDYVGNTTVGNGTSAAPAIGFWNGSPFGSGTVTFRNGGELYAHGTATVTNNLVLNSTGNTFSYNLRSWDAPLTFAGQVTLANNVTLSALTSPAVVPFANLAGNLAVPGATTRQPIVFTGALSGTGGLTVTGQGIVILDPSSGGNSYTGPTTSNGNLIFGSANALAPVSNDVSSNSYVGFADLASGHFATQVGQHVVKTSSGAIGVDTLPGNATATFSDNIDLSNSTGLGFSNPNLRFGTATSAILTGTFKPVGANYVFGNGGGSLYVQSNLGDVPSFLSQLQLNNPALTPLKLYLQGANSYSQGTTSSNGFVIFDGAAAIPATGTLTAFTTLPTSAASGNGGSYIGVSDIGGVNGGAVIGTNAAAFLARFDKTNTWGIIGFDTHAGNTTTTINGVDLTGFNDGVFLGTATSARLTGTLTPSTVTNSTNPANTLRFTAGNGGTLTIDSTLADTPAPLQLTLGTPSTANGYFANGLVVLNGANTYTGGTILNASAQGITVGLGSNTALGTGNATIVGSGLIGLQAMSPGITVANNITFGNGQGLFVTGGDSLTFNGAISGYGFLELQRPAAAANGSVTLGGNNAAFSGAIEVQNTTLNLTHNHAAGTANVALYDDAATVAFSGAATAPVLSGLTGTAGHVVLPNGTGTVLTLAIDDEETHDGDFAGIISGIGQTPTDAALVVTANNDVTNGVVYLHGHNQYTGGTTITDYGILGLGYADSAGTGPITISALKGGVILNTGVTLTNPLVFNSGALAGIGAFAPSAVSGTGQTAGKITVGANQFLFAGIPGGDTRIPGILTLQTNVAFAPGGTLREMIQDPAFANLIAGSAATNVNGGYGFLWVQGDLDLTALTLASFTIAVESIDAQSHGGFSSKINVGQTYQLPFVQTTGSVLGFNAAAFTVDATDFQNGTMDGSLFTVTADSNHLYLNFTPVPEPSTWALLLGGLGLPALVGWRRRRKGA